MRISDWSSDVCSSDLDCLFIFVGKFEPTDCESLPVSSDFGANPQILDLPDEDVRRIGLGLFEKISGQSHFWAIPVFERGGCCWSSRSEEHTSELQSLMRISYAVFCLKQKTPHRT